MKLISLPGRRRSLWAGALLLVTWTNALPGTHVLMAVPASRIPRPTESGRASSSPRMNLRNGLIRAISR